MPTYKIILNPTSGRGDGGRAMPEIENCLQNCGVDYDLVQTREPWHAADLAERAVKDGFDVVTAAGGDGTANEVLNGIIRAKQAGHGSATMGMLGVGSGNDFAFGINIPTEIGEACRSLAGNNRKWMDVGVVYGGDYPEGRYFGNGIGIGFDAAVGFEAAKYKRLHGFPAYTLAALKTIFLYYKAPLVKIEFEGREETHPALMVSIMNGRRMGGGFMMAPDGETDDGLFNLCIAQEVSRPRILGIIPKFMAGTQEDDEAVTMTQGTKVEVIALEGSLPVHADGETVCTEGNSLLVDILPSFIEIIAPDGNSA